MRRINRRRHILLLLVAAGLETGFPCAVKAQAASGTEQPSAVVALPEVFRGRFRYLVADLKMRLRAAAEVQRLLVSEATMAGYSRLRLLTWELKVASSSAAEEMGTRLQADPAAIEALKAGEPRFVPQASLDGKSVQRILIPLLNDQECFACHRQVEKGRTVGLLEIYLPVGGEGSLGLASQPAASSPPPQVRTERTGTPRTRSPFPGNSGEQRNQWNPPVPFPDPLAFADAIRLIGESSGGAVAGDASIEAMGELHPTPKASREELLCLVREVLAARGGALEPQERGYRILAAAKPGFAALRDAHRQFAAAAGRGDLPAVQCFVRSGHPVNALLDGQLPLVAAVAAGQLDIVRALLEAGAAPDRLQGWQEGNALMKAVEGGRLDVARVLIEKGANPDAIETDGKTVLSVALERGNPAVITMLMDAGARRLPTPGDRKRQTSPAESALRTGNLELLRVFLERDPPGDGDGSAALLGLAAALGNLEAAALLVERGADFGQALLFFADTPKDPRPGIDFLLARGAAFTVRDENGTPPLLRALAAGDVSLARAFIEKGAPADGRNAGGRSALHLAAEAGNVAAVQLLIEAGAAVNAPDGDGGTPLMAAVRKGSAEIVALLLGRGADAAAADFTGNTPLHLAQQTRKPDLVAVVTKALEDAAKSAPVQPPARKLPVAAEFLAVGERQQLEQLGRFLAAGASPNMGIVRSGFGKVRALDVLARNGNTEMLQRFLDAGGVVTGFTVRQALLAGKAAAAQLLIERGGVPLRSLLVPLAQAGDLAQVRAALEQGANPNAGERGDLPLHAAVSGKNLEVVRLLLEKGARVNAVRGQGQEGATALGIAARGGNAEIADALVAAGADPNRALLDVIGKRDERRAALLLLERGAALEVRDQYGSTPLMRAVVSTEPSIVELYLGKGADVRARGQFYGRSALHEAASLGNARAVQLLLAAGAPVDARDYDGKTPLALVPGEKSDKAEITRLLVKAGAAVGIADFEGNTPLHFAAQAGDEELVLELIRAGADRAAKNAQGRRPVDALSREQQEGTLKEILTVAEAPRQIPGEGPAAGSPASVAGPAPGLTRVIVLHADTFPGITAEEGRILAGRMARIVSGCGPFEGVALPRSGSGVDAAPADLVRRAAAESHAALAIVPTATCASGNCRLLLELFDGATGESRGRSAEVIAEGVPALLKLGAAQAVSGLAWGTELLRAGSGAPYLRIEQEGTNFEVKDGAAVTIAPRPFRMVFRLKEAAVGAAVEIVVTVQSVWQDVRLGLPPREQDLMFNPGQGMAMSLDPRPDWLTVQEIGEWGPGFHYLDYSATPTSRLELLPPGPGGVVEAAYDVRSFEFRSGGHKGIDVLIFQERDGRQGIGRDDLLRFRIVAK